VNSTRLGLVGDSYTVSPSGSGLCSFQNSAATILHNRQYQSHVPLSGRNAPETICGLSCRALLWGKF